MIAASPALPATGAYIAGFFAAERLRGRERRAVTGAGKGPRLLARVERVSAQ
jgi:hypothetical protein